MILQLRKIVSLQQQKITDLENYIDGRLARVMSRNPGSLEIDDWAVLDKAPSYILLISNNFKILSYYTNDYTQIFKIQLKNLHTWFKS